MRKKKLEKCLAIMMVVVMVMSMMPVGVFADSYNVTFNKYVDSGATTGELGTYDDPTGTYAEGDVVNLSFTPTACEEFYLWGVEEVGGDGTNDFNLNDATTSFVMPSYDVIVHLGTTLMPEDYSGYTDMIDLNFVDDEGNPVEGIGITADLFADDGIYVTDSGLSDVNGLSHIASDNSSNPHGNDVYTVQLTDDDLILPVGYELYSNDMDITLRCVVDTNGDGDRKLIVLSGSTTITLTALPVPVTPDAPNVTGDDDNDVLVGANGTMEYSIDGGGYVDYDGGNLPDLSGSKTVLIRVKAQGINPCSNDTTVVFTVGAIKPNPPAVSADDSNDVIVDADATMEYRIGVGGYIGYDGGNLPDLSGDKTVYVRVKAVGINPASDDTELTFTLANLPIKPDAPDVTGNDVTDKLIGANALMEYRINGGVYAQYDSNNLPDLTGNKTVDIRYMAQGINPVSDNTTVVFTLYVPPVVSGGGGGGKRTEPVEKLPEIKQTPEIITEIKDDMTIQMGKIFVGYETKEIKYNNNINRAELATVVYKALELDKSETVITVPLQTELNGVWYQKQAELMLKKGYMLNTLEGAFNGSGLVSKGEVVDILNRAFKTNITFEQLNTLANQVDFEKIMKITVTDLVDLDMTVIDTEIKKREYVTREYIARCTYVMLYLQKLNETVVK